jgi:hypothetical protein
MSEIRGQSAKETADKKPEINKFFQGVINGIILSLPVWVILAYIAWRW